MAKSGIYAQDSHKTVITPEAVHSMKRSLPEGRTVPFIVEHDHTTMPFGKVIAVHVRESSEGETLLVGEVEEGVVSQVTHPDSGRILYRVDFDDARPFVRGHQHPEQGQCVVSVGREDFERHGDYERFVKELSQHRMSVRIHSRHSAALESLVTFVLEQPIGAAVVAWVVARIAKQVNRVIDDRFAEALDACLTRVSNGIGAMVRKRTAATEPTVEVICADTVSVRLVVVNSNDAARAFGCCIESLKHEIDAMADLVRIAASITFVFRRGRGWRFYYMTTRAGTVIGSRECWNRTERRIREVERARGARGLSEQNGGSEAGT